MNLAESFDQKTRYLAVARSDDRIRYAAQIRKETAELGIFPAAITPLYQAIGRGELDPLTVPAFNLRGLTYQLARVIWRTILQENAGPVLFELAPSECKMGDQSLDEYAAMVFAAAAREGYRGPVFLQGDHFAIGSAAEEQQMLTLAQEAIAAGFYQIDIDGSHLAGELTEDLQDLHRPNAEVTARMIKALRAQQPANIDLVLGGEVGEIGGENTSVEDLRVFHSLLQEKVPPGMASLSKISAQTGTTHSGIVLPDGSTGQMNVDFKLVSDLSQAARHLGWNGLVQHGASTLSLTDLAKLPAAGVLEVHLATQIQNIVFDHPAFPQQLRRSMQERLVLTTHTAEGDALSQDEQLSKAQLFYKARWAAWGYFKNELWALTPNNLAPIETSLGEWVSQVLHALNAVGRQDLLSRYYPGGHV